MTAATRERSRDAQRAAKWRHDARDIKLDRIADVRRRNACLKDTERFLREYFAEIFYQDFTPVRRAMLAGIRDAAQYGGDQAIAGPRGDGKTRLALFVTLQLILAGKVRFALIISKAGTRAARELDNLKVAIRESDAFAADFPEISQPVRALGGWASRARQQTVHGEFTNMEWGQNNLVFPTIASALLHKNKWNRTRSRAEGQIISSVGIDGAIRGLTVRNERPDLVLLDDIDDRESAGSEVQTADRIRKIEEDVAGLAGPGKAIARVMLCTLINRTCVAAVYTDRNQRPSWRGQRHKLLERPPERADMWEDYVAMREGRDDKDPDARVAHRYYLEHRKEMDAGAAVSNPYRFDASPLRDGEPGQVSALQACYDVIADRGFESFSTEYQNEPPEIEGPLESGITPRTVETKLSGYPKRVVPPNTVALTQGIDVQKAGLHFVVRAWLADATSYVVEYGFHSAHNTRNAEPAAVERAILEAVLERADAVEANPYATADGEAREIDLTLIDSGWLAQAIYQACGQAGPTYRPAKGYGKSQGTAAPSFRERPRATWDCKPGDGWNLRRQRGNLWLVECDADRWKAFEHARWLTGAGRPGCAYIHGALTDEERKWAHRRRPKSYQEHHTYARHICAELEVEDLVRGSLKRFWKNVAGRAQNHYLDASYLSCAAAAMQGITLLGESSPARKPVEHRVAKSLEELAAEARS